MLKRAANFLAGRLAGLLAAGLLLLLISSPRGHPISLLPPPTPRPLLVHVTGAVQNPGVYALPPGSIVQNALDAAGGCSPEAVLTGINLAAPLQDGQQILVGSLDASASGTPVPSALPVSPTMAGKIDINAASAAELELLPGIGPSLAQKIIEYRERYGPFTKPEDLLRVSGIGPAKLQAIYDLIVVN
jgi:competence protein ComEA